MNQLPGDYIIKSGLFINRHSKVLGTDLSERMNDLSFDFENLPHTILRMVYAHVAINHNLMLHGCTLNGEGYCSLIWDLMIPKSVLIIIL